MHFHYPHGDTAHLMVARVAVAGARAPAVLRTEAVADAAAVRGPVSAGLSAAAASRARRLERYIAPLLCGAEGPQLRGYVRDAVQDVCLAVLPLIKLVKLRRCVASMRPATEDGGGQRCGWLALGNRGYGVGSGHGATRRD